MSKEKPSKPKLQKLFYIMIFAIILYGAASFLIGITTAVKEERIAPDTEEKRNYILGKFHINDSDNIGTYNVLFKDGIMTLLIDDIKDMRKLCFENLAYYELTENDYDQIIGAEEKCSEMVNAPKDKYLYSYHVSSGKTFDGRWDSTSVYADNNFWEVQLKFADKNNSYTIIINKGEDNTLHCRINTDRVELEDLKKLHTME